MKIGILGAGLSGIMVGRHLAQQGRDFLIYEKEKEAGGLCRTNKTGEHSWDFAVHALYSRDQDVMRYIGSLPLEYEQHNRCVKIFHYSKSGKRCLLEYPFEIGIRDLPVDEKWACISGYFMSRLRHKAVEVENLEDWINCYSGRGIARLFMVPYNSKIWSCKLSEISAYLVGSKIEPASFREFVTNIVMRNKIGREYQAKFIYPVCGIGSLIDYLKSAIAERIQLDSEVVRLVRNGKKWVIITRSGLRQEVDALISTMPLAELLHCLDLPGIEKEYPVLKWNNTFFVMVGLRSGCNFNFAKDCHWVFFKSNEIFYRITLMHNFSSRFSPAVVAEITDKDGISPRPHEKITQTVINDLIASGIIASSQDITRTDIRLANYTYPIPTVGLEPVKEKIKTILARNNIFLFGRNGNWDYMNMDMVIKKSQEFSDNLTNLLTTANR